MGFTDKDLQQLSEKGISENKVRDQIQTFKEGVPFVDLDKAAVPGDGISKFSKEQELGFVAKFDKSKGGKSLLKFVPASGAASRMFKALFNFLDTYDPKNESLQSYLERTEDKEIKVFSEGLEEFPFFKMIRDRIAGQAKSKDEEVYLLVKEMLSEQNLNYGFYPKGLLPFHNYGEYLATPFEEHLKEASLYAKGKDTAQLHFTISEQHGKMFNRQFDTVKERVSHATATSFNVGYSFQKSSTDTIAVDLDNGLFRNADGSLLFRPGGHGALIENLNDVDSDLIFIKNIDNVVVSQFLKEVADSKKVLAGLLLEVQSKAFEYAKMLDGNNIEGKQLSEAKAFMEEELNVRFPENFEGNSIGDQIEILKDKVNRPIRICGMVKNEGEPGGGPFWIRDRNGNVSLQIIESAQIDMDNNKQVEILKSSTHFNPVDVVCGVKNYKGEKYNLLNFVDPKQGFITEKTKDGKELKALELPGLWNGAMAYWNTIFVEVPLITFNPVKTVNDLLKPAHQFK
ncbi:DUF4301 family protein [Flavobacteriaceae bacterium F89]|uniref:DUF4301 family protein n=2 Tax=Cerina litoralis TaxID=2874477 RepID=A0AAE3JS32_9FLAO|nr:DUF4301 family protein [Cerina litoralis]